LISNVTDGKENDVQSKLDKLRALAPPPQSGANKIEVDVSKRKQRSTGEAAPTETKVKKVKEKKVLLPAEKRKRDKERELVCHFAVIPHRGVPRSASLPGRPSSALRV